MRMAPLIIALAISASAHSADAQSARVDSYWNVSSHDLRSSVNQLDYRIFVSLPPGYSAADSTRYPVFYALDGNDTFPLLQAMRRYLGEGGAMPRAIIVGVGYPDSANALARRATDLTPTPDATVHANTPTGGAAAFLETLRRDVIPFVERRYRASGDRALVGHSYGGLFTFYVLGSAPELFGRYGIFSPATWWDGHRLLDELARRPRTDAPAGVRVFVSVGADENLGMRAEADSVASVIRRLYATSVALGSRQYVGNHMSYFPGALSSALAFLYPVTGCLESLRADGGRLHAVLSGPERVETERWVRRGSNVEGRVFHTGGACFQYSLHGGPAGRATAARVEQNVGGPRTGSGEIVASRVRLRTTEPDRERTADVAGPVALFVPLFIGSIDQVIRLAPSRVGDSVRVLLANFRHAATDSAMVTRVARDSIAVRLPTVELRVLVSPRLEVLGGMTIPADARVMPTRWVVVRQSVSGPSR